MYTGVDVVGDKKDRKSFSVEILRINEMIVVGTARSKRQWLHQLLRRNILLRLLAAKSFLGLELAGDLGLPATLRCELI